MDLDLKVIDSHVHFEIKGYDITHVKENYIKKYGQKKWDILQNKDSYVRRQWQNAWNFPAPEPPDDDYHVTAEKWIGEMEKYHLEKMVFVTSGGNDITSEIVQLHPDKFVGYAHHNPFDKDAAQKLEYAITRQGLKGYKIMAPDLPGRIDDEALNPVWEVAEKYEIPVLIHFGIMGAAGGVANHVNISPIILHDVAKAYPSIPFIIPHFGCGYPRDLLYLAWVCPNIYVDTSGSNQWVRWMPYPLTVKDLFKKYYETIGSHRIIYGTDSMAFPRGYVRQYFELQLRDCVELGMKPDDIQNVFHDNIAKLLK